MLKGEDVFKEQGDDFSSGGGTSFRGKPSERIPMIENVFLEVLGRKPSSREMAYYKYGVMKEDEIRIKLLQSEEHKKILEDAQKLPNLENELKDVKVSERKLLQNREDLKSEMIESKKLLDEKNILIQGLREQVNNPYDLPSQVEKYEEGFDVFTNTRSIENIREERRSFSSKLKELIELLFK